MTLFLLMCCSVLSICCLVLYSSNKHKQFTIKQKEGIIAFLIEENDKSAENYESLFNSYIESTELNIKLYREVKGVLTDVDLLLQDSEAKAILIPTEGSKIN